MTTINELQVKQKFELVEIKFCKGSLSNIFSEKNNKTLQQTLNHNRYKSLTKVIIPRYKDYLDTPLGKFLLICKNNNDDIYKQFLNEYGDLKYCEFKINAEKFLNKKGIYVYTLNDKVVYIGRCKDSMRKRVNQGYGKIHPKNCYKDGQATNCRINSLINENKEIVRLWLWSINDVDKINNEEINLINKYEPKWNIK